jgi:uncharacterized tellurite resistance protein B-like protein
METTHQIWVAYTPAEKGAYLSALISIATSGREGTEAEISYIRDMCRQMQISSQAAALIEQEANTASNGNLPNYLAALKTSELKYPLIADLISYARSDNQYTPEEEQSVERIAAYLNIDHNQFVAVNHLVDKVYGSASGYSDRLQTDYTRTSGLEAEFTQTGISTNTLKHMVKAMAPLTQGELAGSEPDHISLGGAGLVDAVNNFGKSNDNVQTPPVPAFGTNTGTARSGQASGGEPTVAPSTMLRRLSGRRGYLGVRSAFSGIFGSSR